MQRSALILKAILTKWKYEVAETRNGDKAWQVLQKEDAPRLVILDGVMHHLTLITAHMNLISIDGMILILISPSSIRVYQGGYLLLPVEHLLHLRDHSIRLLCILPLRLRE